MRTKVVVLITCILLTACSSQTAQVSAISTFPAVCTPVETVVDALSHTAYQTNWQVVTSPLTVVTTKGTGFDIRLSDNTLYVTPLNKGWFARGDSPVGNGDTILELFFRAPDAEIIYGPMFVYLCHTGDIYYDSPDPNLSITGQ